MILNLARAMRDVPLVSADKNPYIAKGVPDNAEAN
jgi:hypothetical protein